VCFPQSGIPNQDHWLAAADVAALRQVQNPGFGHIWYTGPVKLRQLLEHGEVRIGHGSLDAMGFLSGHFFLCQRQ